MGDFVLIPEVPYLILHPEADVSIPPPQNPQTRESGNFGFLINQNGSEFLTTQELGS